MDTRHHRLVFFLSFLFVYASLAAPAPQSVSEMAGKALNADQQITNAARAVEEALGAGDPAVASGSIATLLVSSDTLICSAWIVSFHVKYRNMMVEACRGATQSELETLQKMRVLLELVQQGCKDIFDPPPPKGEGEEGEEGQEDPEVAPVRYTYPACPQCERVIQDRNDREYELGRDRYLLSVAMKNTDYARSVWDDPNADPGGKAVISGTLDEVSARETELWVKVSQDEAAYEAAHQAVLESLALCLQRTETSFLQENAVPLGIGAAAAGVGLAFAAGGEDTPEGGGIGGPPAMTGVVGQPRKPWTRRRAISLAVAATPPSGTFSPIRVSTPCSSGCPTRCSSTSPSRRSTSPGPPPS